MSFVQPNKPEPTSKQNHKGRKNKPKKRAPVNLGYKAELVEDQKYADAFTSKLGGKPDWLNPSPPTFEETAKCGNCKDDLTFLLQLYAPLFDSPHDRTLYLFICLKPACSGTPDSINIIRAMNYNEKYARQMKEAKKKCDAFNKSSKQANKKLEDLGSIWGSTSGFELPAQTVSKFSLIESMENLTLKEPPAQERERTSSADITQVAGSLPWPNESLSLPSYYIATEIEEFWPVDSDHEVALSIGSFERAEESVETGQQTNFEENASWAGEVYEKSIKPKGVDKAFLAFSARAAYSPGHLLRYDFGGSPLLYSLADSVADQLLGFPGASAKRSKLPITFEHLPVCEGCGGRRTFEFQVMPSLMSELPIDSLTAQPSHQEGASKDLRSLLLECTSWEFGTLLIFTCEKNCVVSASPDFDGGYFKELALIQMESPC